MARRCWSPDTGQGPAWEAVTRSSSSDCALTSLLTDGSSGRCRWASVGSRRPTASGPSLHKRASAVLERSPFLTESQRRDPSSARQDRGATLGHAQGGRESEAPARPSRPCCPGCPRVSHPVVLSLSRCPVASGRPLEQLPGVSFWAGASRRQDPLPVLHTWARRREGVVPWVRGGSDGPGRGLEEGGKRRKGAGGGRSLGGPRSGVVTPGSGPVPSHSTESGGYRALRVS